MLNIKKSITLSGQSMIDVGGGQNVAAEGYQAVIENDNPENMNLSSWQIDKAICKKYRAQCREDSAEFEDVAYTLQDEMIAENESERG